MDENLRYNPEIDKGLNEEQILKRKEQNLVNKDTTVPTKSIKSIIISNFFTIFNFMNLFLALAIYAVGEYKNMLFIIIVIINTAISTIQEIHSKKVIDKLSLISSTKVTVIRSGIKKEIEINEIVLDDILQITQGNQIVTDCIIQQGEIEVNESLVTGEADSILKKKGDLLISGSYVVSGKCIAKVEHIGEDNFTSKISKETKYIKKVKSEIMTALNNIINTVSALILPISILLFWNQLTLDGGSVSNAVIHTVAAIIGMIPEGLVLLTSTVLAVSVVRLSKSKVLVQELFCIETLARVDTLCLDKTGTITEGKMEVSKLIPLNSTEKEMEEILANIGKNSEDSNSTIEAIRERFCTDRLKSEWEVIKNITFSSERKWSGIEFKQKGCYIIGAPEYIINQQIDDVEKYISEYRVIVLAHSKQGFKDKELPDEIEVLGLVCITDKIRKNVTKTLEYFRKQGVDIRIISGDNPITVSHIAKRAGVIGYEDYVDCSTLKNDEDVKDVAKKYKIFGRVSPMQKKQLIKALKEQGHTVAMTGDGVNDIIALKEADCSVAMASGSAAARNVSQLVLLDSNFDSMPKIVAEGRKTINNLERSASLFLTKTIYSSILAVLFVIINAKYPFMPIQLSLISLVCIGIPSFILALEPNKQKIKGRFLENVISKSIPTAFTVIANIIIVLILNNYYNFSTDVYASICVLLTVLTGFLLLFRISIPFNLLRITLFGGLVGIFLGCCTLFRDWFNVYLPQGYIEMIIALALTTISIFIIFNLISSKILQKFKRRLKI